MLYKVYGLYEAGKPEEIQYVGCTTQTLRKRLKGHICDCRREFRPINLWIASVLDSKRKVDYTIFMQTECARTAFKTEMKMIAHFAKLGGPLHNVDGARCRSRENSRAKERAKQAQERKLEKAFADVEATLAIVRARIADGSLDINSFLTSEKD